MIISANPSFDKDGLESDDYYTSVGTGQIYAQRRTAGQYPP